MRSKAKWIWNAGIIMLFLIASSCTQHTDSNNKFMGKKNEVKLMVLDPGHFHAGLVQKFSYNQVDPRVFVYAPEGPELNAYLGQVEAYNERNEKPTNWDLQIYSKPDFKEQIWKQRKGNVLVLSGNNSKKTDYILSAVENGLHVFSDKPMAISKEDYLKLEKAFAVAARENLLLYDIMTERFEISTILQKELAHSPEVFGELLPGSAEDPSVTKESVHHFNKKVSGKDIVRPDWFFDSDQQGEGLVDVSTHLVDLVQWECYPEVILDKDRDVSILSAKRWPVLMSDEEFTKVTRKKAWPGFLQKKVNEEGYLEVYSNGEIVFRLKDIVAKVSVIWKFEAEEGGKDSHFSIMKGSKADLIIEQGAQTGYKPELFVRYKNNANTCKEALLKTISRLEDQFPGLKIRENDSAYQIEIPEELRLGHEAHFGQVTRKYLQYLTEGKLPDWEITNTLCRYYITTQALEIAKSK